MNSSVIVNIQELKNIKSKIELNSTELVSILKKVVSDTELTKECFDNLTGEEFRKEMIDYLNDRITFIQNNYLSFSKRIDMIISDYTDFYDSIQKMVGDSQ